MGGFPKLGVPFWGGGPIIRTIVYWGLDWGPLILGNYYIFLKNQPMSSNDLVILAVAHM